MGKVGNMLWPYVAIASSVALVMFPPQRRVSGSLIIVFPMMVPSVTVAKAGFNESVSATVSPTVAESAGAVAVGASVGDSMVSVLSQEAPASTARSASVERRTAGVKTRIMLYNPCSQMQWFDTRTRRGASARHGRNGGSSSERVLTRRGLGRSPRMRPSRCSSPDG